MKEESCRWSYPVAQCRFGFLVNVSSEQRPVRLILSGVLGETENIEKEVQEDII